MLITIGNADVNALDLESRSPLHSCGKFNIVKSSHLDLLADRLFVCLQLANATYNTELRSKQHFQKKIKKKVSSILFPFSDPSNRYKSKKSVDRLVDIEGIGRINIGKTTSFKNFKHFIKKFFISPPNSLARQPRSYATLAVLRRHSRPRLQTRRISAWNLSSRRPRRMRFGASSIQRQPTQVRSLWANAVQTRLEVKPIWSHQNSREPCEKQ